MDISWNLTEISIFSLLNTRLYFYFNSRYLLYFNFNIALIIPGNFQVLLANFLLYLLALFSSPQKTVSKFKQSTIRYLKVHFYLLHYGRPKRTVYFQFKRIGPRRVYTFLATTLPIPALWPTGAGQLSGS